MRSSHRAGDAHFINEPSGNLSRSMNRIRCSLETGKLLPLPARSNYGGSPMRRSDALSHSRDRRIDARNVRPQVFAVGARALVGTARLQLVVSTASTVVIHKLHRSSRRREEIVRRPCRYRSDARNRHDGVVGYNVTTKSIVQGHDWRIVSSTIERAISTRGPHRISTGVYDVIREPEI